MAEASEDQILDDALAPKKITGDEGSVEEHPIPDKILADKYLLAKRAAKKGFGVRMVRIIQPGAHE
jgi:hypothetical protein